MYYKRRRGQVSLPLQHPVLILPFAIQFIFIVLCPFLLEIHVQSYSQQNTQMALLLQTSSDDALCSDILVVCQISLKSRN